MSADAPAAEKTPSRRRQRRGSWRVALRYAWRDARRHKGRTALVAAMVALPTGLGSAVAVLATSTYEESPATAVAQRLGADPQIQAVVEYWSPGAKFQNPHDGGLDGVTYSTDDLGPWEADGDSQNVQALPIRLADLEEHLGAAVPEADTVSRVSTESGTWTVRSAADPTRSAAATLVQVDGPPAALHHVGVDVPLGAGQIAIGPQVAAALGVGVGDTVELTKQDAPQIMRLGDSSSFREFADPRARTTAAQRYTVAAVDGDDQQAVVGQDGPLTVPTTLDWWRDDATNPDLTWALRWVVTGPAPVRWSEVSALNELGAQVSSRDTILHPPTDAATLARWDEVMAGNDYGPGNDTSAAGLAVVAGAAALGLLQAILMIGPAFQVGARRSARDLALLAASGADDRTIRRSVLAGGLVVGTVVSAVACTLGVVISSVLLVELTDMTPVRPWLWVVAFFVVGVLVSVAAAWLPARRAAHLDPVAVLAGRRAEAPPRRWPGVVGVVLAAVGVAVAVAGAAARLPTLVLVAGVVLAELGLVLATGPVIQGLGRLSGTLRGTGRLALRDAARHRARTASATAAVLAATAAAVAGLVLAPSMAQHDRLTYEGLAAPGTLLVGPFGKDDGDLSAADQAAVARVVQDRGAATGALLPVTAFAATDAVSQMWVLARSDVHEMGAGTSTTGLGTVVDDGSSVERLRLLGIPDPERAAEALREGRALVQPTELRDDATAVVVLGHEGSGEAPDVPVPAIAVGDGVTPVPNLPILPTTFAREHGLGLRTSGVVAASSVHHELSDAELVALDDALEIAVPSSDELEPGWNQRVATASAWVEAGPSANLGSGPLTGQLLIAGAAILVTLAAAWIATALAGTESLPDLATLQAVGAPPRIRRRFAAAQSAVITMTGVVLGAVTGLVLGATIVLAQRLPADGSVDPRWMIDVPWRWVVLLVVAVPLLGALGSWVATRSRLPLGRRLDR